MRPFAPIFAVDGQPLLAPDAGMEQSFEDLDSADSGRDEAGVMHRAMVRTKVGTWSFAYAFLTEEERQYLLSLFAGKSTFVFTHPGKADSARPESCAAYMSKYGLAWHDAKRGLWRNLKFNIIEC